MATATKKQKRKAPANPIKLVDPTKLNVLQTGSDGVPIKEPDIPEKLDTKEMVEKQIYQRLLKRMVPKYPLEKLEKATLEDLAKFFDELPEITQEEILRRYKNISP